MTRAQKYPVFCVVLLLGILNGAGFVAATPSDGPRTLVEGFHGKLLDVMKAAESLGIKGRYARLEPEVGRRFDLPLMMALAAGKHWRQAGPQDKKRLVDAFQRFSAATYASRFSDFSGESFETMEVQPGPRRTQLVRTRINRPDDAPVTITYVTRAVNGAWRIVDVLVDDGISEIATRRSEYHSILKNDGIDGLVRVLDNKTKLLLANQTAE